MFDKIKQFFTGENNMFKDRRTIITAVIFGLYNVSVAMWPRLGETISSDLVNSLLQTLMVIFLRLGIVKAQP